jgi:ribosome-associated translation inhibitor RaiA
MHEHLQITFRGVSPSPAVKALIDERTERLAQVNPLIQRCHVVVEQPHRHHHKGRPLSVRIDIVTPFGEVVVTRALEDIHRHEPLQTLIRDAFDAATRQLEERTERRRAS